MIVNILQDGVPTIEVLQSITPSVVEIVTAGPQGPVGPPGTTPDLSYLATTGSNIFNGDQIISGSLQVTNGISGVFSGSLTTSGSVFLKGLTSTAQSNVILIDTASGQLYFTASSTLGGGGDGGGGGVTNLSYIPSPTNGTVVSDTGTGATLPLADSTNAGLLAPADFTKLGNQSGTNTGDNATNTQYSGLAASKQDVLGFTPYNATNPSGYQTASQVQTIADGKVSQNITNGVTTTAPSENAVFDALALKAPLASPTFTGTVTLPKTTTINTYSPIVNIIKDVVPTTPITGTLTETIFNSYLIPANTFSAMDMMKIPYFEANKVGTTSTLNVKIYVNTSNTLTGAVQIARYVTPSTALYLKMSREFNINAGVLTGFQFSNSNTLTDYSSLATIASSTSFNPTIDNYIITTGQLSVITDSIQQRGFCVTN